MWNCEVGTCEDQSYICWTLLPACRLTISQPKKWCYTIPVIYSQGCRSPCRSSQRVSNSVEYSPENFTQDGVHRSCLSVVSFSNVLWPDIHGISLKICRTVQTWSVVHQPSTKSTFLRDLDPQGLCFYHHSGVHSSSASTFQSPHVSLSIYLHPYPGTFRHHRSKPSDILCRTNRFIDFLPWTQWHLLLHC